MKQTIEITPIRALRDNYIWLLRRAQGRAAVVVDPGEAQPVLDELERGQLALAAIVVTHHHHDHVGGIDALVQSSGARVYGPAAEHIPQRNVAVHDGDTVLLPELDLSLRALAVPGHTLGATAYIGEEAVFTGDTLFTAGCGRLFEGTAAQMHRSLSTLAALPDAMQVYCGHEYTLANLRFAVAVEPGNATIAARLHETETMYRQHQPAVPASMAQERDTNPFLRCGQSAVHAAAEKYSGRTLAEPVDVFTVLREWKNRF